MDANNTQHTHNTLNSNNADVKSDERITQENNHNSQPRRMMPRKINAGHDNNSRERAQKTQNPTHEKVSHALPQRIDKNDEHAKNVSERTEKFNKKDGFLKNSERANNANANNAENKERRNPFRRAPRIITEEAQKSRNEVIVSTDSVDDSAAEAEKHGRGLLRRKDKTLKVRFLGGVGEIGKNMTALEYGNDILIIDDGLTFPSFDMPGIDLVIPDTTFLVQNRDKVRGVVLTHGHEDHIGGLPFLLKDINVPVYGTKLTLALAENKLREQNIRNFKLNCVKAGSKVNLGCFSVEFINVNHSIAGACALAITTPVGVVVHSGDFKIDLTPINGEIMDITRLSEIGKKGVLLLLCESTNVERRGYSMSEHVVGETLDKLFGENARRRLIIATFATNVYRVQQIINLAVKYRRKVAFSGRSMINVAEAASKIGEMTIPEGTIVDIDKIKNVSDKDLVIISTGSQGEPMSALTRMASDDFSQVAIGDNDTIIISASPIPGNEKSIFNVINNLYRKGAEVVYEQLNQIHVSGHACQEELKIFHSLIKPKFFIPVHGEYRHLKKHYLLAREMGMKDGNMLICDIGDTVELTPKSMKRGEKFQAGSKLVDGLTIDDTESTVRDRKMLAEDGIIVAICCISAESGEFMQEPSFICRGISLNEAQLNDCKGIIARTLNEFDIKEIGDNSEFRRQLRKNLKNYIFKKTKNNPMILPVITEI